MSGLSHSLSSSRFLCFFLFPIHGGKRGPPSCSFRALGPPAKKVSIQLPLATSLNIQFSLPPPLQTLPYGVLPFAGRTVGIPQNVKYSLQKLKMPTTHRAPDETSIRLQKNFQSSPRIILPLASRPSTLRTRRRSPFDEDLRTLSKNRDRSSSLPDLWPVARNPARLPQSTGLS